MILPAMDATQPSAKSAGLCSIRRDGDRLWDLDTTRDSGTKRLSNSHSRKLAGTGINEPGVEGIVRRVTVPLVPVSWRQTAGSADRVPTRRGVPGRTGRRCPAGTRGQPSPAAGAHREGRRVAAQTATPAQSPTPARSPGCPVTVILSPASPERLHHLQRLPAWDPIGALAGG